MAAENRVYRHVDLLKVGFWARSNLGIPDPDAARTVKLEITRETCFFCCSINTSEGRQNNYKTREMKFSGISVTAALAVTAAAKNVFDIGALKDSFGKREAQPGQLPLFEAPPLEAGGIPIYIPEGEEPQRGPTLLTSGINTNRDISVFAGYVRDDVAVSQLCNDRKKQTVVFAPTDDGIDTLAMKPWQFPTPVDDDATEEQIAATIESNVDNFIRSHMVDGSVPFEALDSGEKKGALLETLNGKRLKLVNDDGDYYVYAVDGPDEWLKVQAVTNVDNGAILIIDKPLVAASIL